MMKMIESAMEQQKKESLKESSDNAVPKYGNVEFIKRAFDKEDAPQLSSRTFMKSKKGDAP